MPRQSSVAVTGEAWIRFDFSERHLMLQYLYSPSPPSSSIKPQFHWKRRLTLQEDHYDSIAIQALPTGKLLTSSCTQRNCRDFNRMEKERGAVSGVSDSNAVTQNSHRTVQHLDFKSCLLNITIKRRKL